MQYRLLDLVCCPSCKGDVGVEIFETKERPPVTQQEANRCRERCAYVETGIGPEPDCISCSKIEVVCGAIRCACGKGYPIVRGIPRFLPEDLQHKLVDRYPEFFALYGEQIDQGLCVVQRDKLSKLDSSAKCNSRPEHLRRSLKVKDSPRPMIEPAFHRLHVGAPECSKVRPLGEPPSHQAGGILDGAALLAGVGGAEVRPGPQHGIDPQVLHVLRPVVIGQGAPDGARETSEGPVQGGAHGRCRPPPPRG